MPLSFLLDSPAYLHVIKPFDLTLPHHCIVNTQNIVFRLTPNRKSETKYLIELDLRIKQNKDSKLEVTSMKNVRNKGRKRERR